MTATTVTLQGRTAAEARMLDACTITRDGGSPTFNPTTGVYTTPAGSTIYTGKCEVQLGAGLTAQDAEVGGMEIDLSRLTVKVPTSVEGVEVDDIVTITASELDPTLVGQVYRVTQGFSKSFATSRRFQVERLVA